LRREKGNVFAKERGARKGEGGRNFFCWANGKNGFEQQIGLPDQEGKKEKRRRKGSAVPLNQNFCAKSDPFTKRTQHHAY